VKGTIIRAHLDWVRDHRSRAEIIALFEDIADFLRYQISTLTPAAWYPFRTLIAVDRVIVDHFGNGEAQFARELGGYLAQTTLADIRRFFGAILSIAPQQVASIASAFVCTAPRRRCASPHAGAGRTVSAPSTCRGNFDNLRGSSEGVVERK
jgi:hypothetical protein